MNASTCATLSREPGPTLVLSEKAFVNWLGAAQSGHRVRYHQGHLATDRVFGLGKLTAPECRELAAIANRAVEPAEDGRLLLVQKRHGPGDYSYFAVKPKRLPPRRTSS